MDVPIDQFAGLIDCSRIFLSADTGPLHLASARKICPDSKAAFRNNTAVIGVFGATSGRIYGYDSFSRLYLSSAQDPPSKIFEGSPPCKNLTCIDKVNKKCLIDHCFEGVEAQEIVDYIDRYLSGIR